MKKDFEIKTINSLSFYLKKAIKKLDKNKQIVQAMEEMGELIQQLAKEHNDKPRKRENLITELADVLIMLLQMIHLFSTPEEIVKEATKKVEKIKAYIEKQKEKNNGL